VSPEELCEEYLRVSALRPRTEISYRNVVNAFVNDTQAKDLDEVTLDLVISWRDDVLKRATETTWHTYQRTLRAMWNYALDQEYVAENPFQKVRAPRRGGKVKKTLSSSTVREAIRYLEKCDGTDKFKPAWFWLTVFKTLIHTGMRTQQLVSMRWRDINFDRGTILLSYVGSKSHREWQIPIPRRIDEELRYLAEMSRKYSNRTLKQLRNEQVFRIQLFNDAYAGSEMTPSQVFGFFRRLSQVMKVKISPHRLRHTFATMLATTPSVDLRTLQYLLGHTDIRVTMGYVHPMPSVLKSALDSIEIEPKKEID